MKKSIIFLLAVLLLVPAIMTVPAFSQDEEEVYEIEILKYWKEKYEAEFKNVMFEDVTEAITQAVAEHNACAVLPSTPKMNDEGFMKQIIKSDYCIFAMGDSTYRDMQKYSVLRSQQTVGHECLPFIPGARWKNGRIKFKFLVKEIDDETIQVILPNAEISGKEEAVTVKHYFWESNGILETNIMARIKELVEESKE